jgi:hypothetical protein
MSKPTSGDSYPPPKRIVEVCGGGTVRIKPEYVPDIVCWLIAYSRRWQRQAASAMRRCRGPGGGPARAELTALRHSLSTIQQVVDGILDHIDKDTFDRASREWNDAVWRLDTVISEPDPLYDPALPPDQED